MILKLHACMIQRYCPNDGREKAAGGHKMQRRNEDEYGRDF